MYTPFSIHTTKAILAVPVNAPLAQDDGRIAA